MTLWTWKTWQNQPFLTCALLPQPHGFFTQHFYPQSPEELADVLSPKAQVYRVKQVHSGDVLTPTEIETALEAGLPALPDGTQAAFPLADGIVSEQSYQAVWACSADCTPALIGDIVTGQVSAVHAGWRGTAQRILPEAVSKLKSQGSQLENLRVALGPAIDGRVYQVGTDVAAKVGVSVAPHLQGEALIEHLMSVKNPPVLDDPAAERVRLDVRRINQMQLEQLGIDPDQIAIAPHCTYQEPKNFFSYRRTKEKKVQWSGIVSK
ncbi:MAG: peptidoglycan editing factor PgeF [Cyanobacteria bacterium J06627_32]